MNEKCRDCGLPADLEQTMNFDDIGMPLLYWCTKCGIFNNKLNEELQKNFKKDPSFAVRLSNAIDEVLKKDN